MVLRYPAVANTAEDDSNVFFQLKSRSMAKFFRPKQPLCGQPMTLSVGGTVFCCRAILTNEDSGNEQNNDSDQNELVLFSVIVALVPRKTQKSEPLPISGWLEDKRSASISSKETIEPTGTASASFLAVKNVHISLARICRVLEREENRCSFVSLQSEQFHQIRRQMETESEHRQNALQQSKQTPGSSSSSPMSVTNKGQGSSKHHRRTSSFRGIERADSARTAMKNSKGGITGSVDEDQLFEAMSTTAPPIFPDSGIPHEGNLARDMMDFFHAISRSEDIAPTPLDVLMARKGTVFVNQHVAVAIESVTTSNHRIVWPFQTLLFPKVSPVQLRETMATSSITPGRLQQLLLVLSPQKALCELDTNLPISNIIEIAEYLVSQGVAKPFAVLLSSTRLACKDLTRIENLSLPFIQTFHIDLAPFVLVSFLTHTNRTIGDCVHMLKHSGDSVAKMLRKQIMASRVSRHSHTTSRYGLTIVGDRRAEAAEERERPESQVLEDTLWRIVVWLLTREVIVQLHEYLVTIDSVIESEGSGKIIEGERKIEHGSSTDEMVFRQLSDAGCLSGQTTLSMCAWRLSVDAKFLRDWAERHSRVRIVKRAASSTDDYAPDTKPTRSLG